MRFLSLFAAVLAFVWFAPFAARAQTSGFVPELNDVPVLGGLVRLPDRGFYFDSPAVRIAEVYFLTELKQQMVTDFYARTLPQLGWAALNETTFTRQHERLTLLYENGENTGTLIVRFLLSPQTHSSQIPELEDTP